MRQSSWSVRISNSTFSCQIYWVLSEFIPVSLGFMEISLKRKMCLRQDDPDR